jgi:hypothetical protein
MQCLHLVAVVVIGVGLWLQVFDSSKVAVQPVEEANDKKFIVAVGSSTHRVRRPAYVEHGLDPEVTAALENSEGPEFDSAEELEDDSVVFANILNRKLNQTVTHSQISTSTVLVEQRGRACRLTYQEHILEGYLQSTSMTCTRC